MDAQSRRWLTDAAMATVAVLRNDFEVSGEEHLLALALTAGAALTELAQALRP